MKKLGLVFTLALFASIAWGQNTFNKFAPANGVLKGSTTTYVTSAAVDADIIALWTGTCNTATYLRGDGTCATPPGTGGGTVNSVGQTVPAGFAVSGSPVTNSGVLAITYATGQTNHLFLGTSTIGQLGEVAITTGDLPTIPFSQISGTVPANQGGTGEAGTVTGIAKANGTSAFTAAVASDVYGLWSGTCSSSTFLNGAGACAAPPATGVTSIAIAVPSGQTVTGSPITTSGTITIGGVLNAVAGGSGEAGTITGVLKGNGTSAHTAAVAADVYGLWSGSCSVSTFLRGDGSCAAPGGTSFANPSAVIGLTANNGTATTAMRSDASPALSQTISPVMTGNWEFSPTSGTAILINSTAGSAGVRTIGASGSGAFDWYTDGGSGTRSWLTGAGISVTGDYEIYDDTAGASRLQISSTGNINIPAPTSGTGEIVTAASGAAAFQAIATGSTQVAQFDGGGSTGGNIESGDNGRGNIWLFGRDNGVTGNFVWAFNNVTPKMSLTPSGNLVVASPSSGAGITDGGCTAGTAFVTTQFQACNPGGDALFTTLDSTNGIEGLFGSDTTEIVMGSFSSSDVVLRTGNTTRMSIAGSNGAITVAPPTSAGNALSVIGIAGSTAVNIAGPNTAGNSFGLTITAGTNTSDDGIRVFNAAGSTEQFAVRGDGTTLMGFGGAGDIFAASGNVALGAATSGVTLAVGGVNASFSEVITASAATSGSDGLQIFAGTNSSDFPVRIVNAAQTVQMFGIQGDGGVTLGGPTGGDEGLGTINAQEYYRQGIPLSGVIAGHQTASWTFTSGCSGGISPSSVTVNFDTIGKVVTMSFPEISCTATSGSPGATFILSGTFPSGTTPSHSSYVNTIPASGGTGTVTNAGANEWITSSGLEMILQSVVSGVFNACSVSGSGTGPTSILCSLTYTLN